MKFLEVCSYRRNSKQIVAAATSAVGTWTETETGTEREDTVLYPNSIGPLETS